MSVVRVNITSCPLDNLADMPSGSVTNANELPSNVMGAI